MFISQGAEEDRRKALLTYLTKIHQMSEAVVDSIVWQLDLQLPMQSVPNTTDVASSNLYQSRAIINDLDVILHGFAFDYLTV